MVKDPFDIEYVDRDGKFSFWNSNEVDDCPGGRCTNSFDPP